MSENSEKKEKKDVEKKKEKPSDRVKTENYKFFQHRECEFFPCHQVKDDSKFNCLFCYCPLYTLGDQCGGNFTYINGDIKDCSKCLAPHGENSYDFIISRWSKVDALAKTQIHKKDDENKEEE